MIGPEVDGNFILERLIIFIPLLLSLTVHEYAHALSAFKLGDDTAARQGRMTLNPIVHIDPIGTLLLPLLGVPFGWAKPVPVSPVRFRRDVTMSTGMMITAAAGPVSNIILAVLSTVIYGLLIRFGVLSPRGPSMFAELLGIAIQLNIALALFNLIPVPPLDGSRIVDGLLPYKFRAQWEQIQRAGPLLLVAVIFFGGRIIMWPSFYIRGLLMDLLTWIALA